MGKRLFICAIFCGFMVLWGCGHKEKLEQDMEFSEQQTTEDETVSQTLAWNEAITFMNPAIEEKTREILGKADGAITRADVLAITEFGMNAECAMPFQDLQWYHNLEKVRLPRCGVKSLEGVEKLTALKVLWVRDNDITDIEPVRELDNLVEFSCAANPVSDYSPVSGLTDLEKLQIGDNGFLYTDIGFLSGLTKLTSLYAPWCGIVDISPLKNLTELEYLNLFHDQIEDVSALENLDKLTYLELRLNQIADITPLYGLDRLTHINLSDNKISEEELARFYEVKNSTPFTVIQKGKLREDMPEFTFTLTAYFDLQTEGYALQSLDICEDDKSLQTISIPELAWFGQTCIYDFMRDTLGFELEDVNFDGYQDIRLFDTPNGNYRQEYIYLVWNPQKQQFEYDARLCGIPLATFDQEERLIYSMERGGAVCHYYSTYQYIDGEPTKIRYVEEEGLHLTQEQIERYYAAATTDNAGACEGGWFYVHIMERNEMTGDLETISEEYVFYPLNGEESGENEKIHVDIASELGRQIAEGL